jgi:branched-chain amino acid transport system substrate-binding protein
MRKFTTCLVIVLAVTLAFTTSSWSRTRETVIKVGLNAPITGDIPKVGEGSKYAAQMWLEDIKKAGGLDVGGTKYKVEVIVEDNESKAESAVKANTKMITEDEVMAIVGPQSSAQAVPAGEMANNYETPMISPWSTNPDTTKDRPYVFRGCFPRSVSGTGGGQLCQEKIRIHQSRRAV